MTVYNVKEKVIALGEQIADDNNYRYNMYGDRWTGYEHLKGTSQQVAPWYFDCSSFVSSLFELITGVNYTQNETTYTGNMYNYFVLNGFTDVTGSNIIKRGDVLLNHNTRSEHVVIATGREDVTNDLGVTKYTVQAKGVDYGIVKNEPTTAHFDYILRYNEVTPQWHGKKYGGYPKESDEAIENAMKIYDQLSQKGFSIQAVSAILGSMQIESGYNPFRYEMDIVPNMLDIYFSDLGYGFVQFTPRHLYYDIGGSNTMNFNDREGNLNDDCVKQCEVISNDSLGKWYPQHPQRHTPSQYNLTWSQFKSCTDLTIANGAWIYGYEFPSNTAQQVVARLEFTNYWYEVLSGYTPQPVPPVPTVTRNKLPVWLMYKIIERS